MKTALDILRSKARKVGHNPDSFVLWSGPSQLDGSPVALVATGLGTGSSNAKTGEMVQTYIVRADVDPCSACDTGADSAVCGSCPFRGATGHRACYVNVGRPVASVYRCYSQGRGYLALTTLDDIATVGEGRNVRCGSYGDPAAVPLEVWRALLSKAHGWTGYTHQWRTCPDGYREFLMASVETEKGFHEAHDMGWRTFRARLASEPLLGDEVVCPASAEAGHRTQCDRCRLCRGGMGGPSGVCIIAHGTPACKRKFAELKARLAAAEA